MVSSNPRNRNKKDQIIKQTSFSPKIKLTLELPAVSGYGH